MAWIKVTGESDDAPLTEDLTERMEIPGGWLYRTIVRGGGGGANVSMVFVPDQPFEVLTRGDGDRPYTREPEEQRQ